MNLPSLDKYVNTIRPGGVVVINSSIISSQVTRPGIRAVMVPGNEIAEGSG
jgi:2-oxoglutarate ferredoxin oxidoreductase subunit gamma